MMNPPFLIDRKQMQHASGRMVILLAISMTLFLPACKKTGSGPSGGGPNTKALYYPTTISSYQGTNGAYPSIATCKYDSQHRLTYLGNDAFNYTINSENVTQTVLGTSGETDITYNNYNGNIYTGGGTTSVDNSALIKTSNTSYTIPARTYLFAYTSNNALSAFDDGANTTHFSYDDNGNLTGLSLITDPQGSPNSGSYKPGGDEIQRMTFKGYDTNPSPFSAVSVYRFVTMPWGYSYSYPFAFSRHNPAQVIEEDLNSATRQWYVYSQTDYTYTYNEHGYPSQVKFTVTYPANNNSVYYFTYNFTYTN